MNIKILKKSHESGWQAIYEADNKIFIVDSSWKFMYFYIYIKNQNGIWENIVTYDKDIKMPATEKDFLPYVETFIIQNQRTCNLIKTQCLKVLIKKQPKLSEYSATYYPYSVETIDIEWPDVNYEVYDKLTSLPVKINNKETVLVLVYDSEYKYWYADDTYYFFTDKCHTKEEIYKKYITRYIEEFKKKQAWGEEYIINAKSVIDELDEALRTKNYIS